MSVAPVTSWWWIRHAPTHEEAFVGWRDVPANLSDKAALARLRAALPAEALLASSDLSRAKATADAIAAPGHARLPPARALREFDFGAWDGLGFAAVSARDPALSRAFWERPGDIAAPGGESWNDVAARVSAWVDAQNRAAPRHVIAVAHFGVILTQLQRTLGVAPAEVLAYRIAPLSLTRLDWDGQGWKVRMINHVA